MIAKINSAQGRVVLAVCDSELLGKKFEEGNRQLDLTVDFYKGEEKTEEEIAELFKKINYINLVGEKSVALGIKEGIVQEEHVIKIAGIPHAETLIIKEE